MNRITIFLMFFISLVSFGQKLKVELPDRLDYTKYWNDNKIDRVGLDYNFDNITKANNKFWGNKMDPRRKNGKNQYQYWKHLTKQIKFIEENIYDQPYKKSDAIDHKNSYSFDSFGSITQKINSFNDGSSLIKEELKYNEAHNIIEYAKYDSSSYTNNEYRLEEKYTFTYNDNQQLIAEQKENATSIFYDYNNNGQIEKIEKFGYHPRNSGIIAYASNTSDEEIEKYKKELRSNLLIRYNFKYDDSGNRILEQKKDLITNKIIYKRVYEFGTNNLLTKFIVDNYVFEYKYSENNNLLIEEKLTDTESKEEFTAYNVYNSQGLLISNTSPASSGNKIYVSEFEYDSNNNIIKETNSKILYNEKEEYLFKTQEYDSHNNLTKCISVSDYRAIETYTYDINNRLLRYLRENQAENKVYQDYNFKYDENGGVIEYFFYRAVKLEITYY